MVDYIKKKEMASVAVTLEADSPDDMKVHELDTVDGVIIDHILSDEECATYHCCGAKWWVAYWDPDEVEGEEYAQCRHARVDDSTLCDAIYSRLLPASVKQSPSLQKRRTVQSRS